MIQTLALNFADPVTAGIAASVAVPTLLILYFLKLRRRDVEISTTLLWKKAIEDLQANAPFQRLRKNLLLLLQLLALAAALFGLAQPELKGVAGGGERHLLLIDASASMNTVDATNAAGDTVSRLEAAKEDAIEVVESLREPGWLDKESGDRAMVIVYDRSARALQTFTGDKRVLRQVIESIQATDGPTSGEEAWQLVEAQAPRLQREEVQPDGTVKVYDLPPQPVGTIHLFSDGRIPDAEKMTPNKEDGFIYHAVGSVDAVNVGITSLRAGRAFDAPNRLSVFVGLQSTDSNPREADVELVVDGAVIQTKAVALPPATSTGPPAPTTPAAGSPEATAAPAVTPARTPGTGGVVFTFDRPEGGVIMVRLVRRSDDSLRTDDTSWVVVPPAKRLAVAVVTRGNLFLSTGLEGLPLAKIDQMTPEQYSAMAKAGTVGEYDVAILDGWLPEVVAESGAEAAALPPGRFLIFNAIPAVPSGPDVTGEGGVCQVLDWRRDHPVLRGMSLDNLTIAKSRLVEVPKNSPLTVLATSDTGPVLLEIASGATRAIVATFDPTDSNWPLTAGFVWFLGSAVTYLGDDQAGLSQMVRPGDTLADRLPIGARDVRLRGPVGGAGGAGSQVDAILSPAPDGRVVFGPVRNAGVYNVSWTGEAGPRDFKTDDRAVRPFAANLLDGAESDVCTLTQIALGSNVVQAKAQAGGGITRRLWPWLLLAALMVLLFEWFIYNRKVQL